MFARKATVAAPSSPTLQFPADWISSLKKLLEAAKLSEFRTVDALLAAVMFDDVAAGSMLYRLLYWHGRLGREFYLSNQDWWEQCRVKRSDIDRAKKLFPACGVEFAVKFSKSANANVTHYQLNAKAFSRRLADVLGVSVLHLAERLAGIQQNVVSESSRTLTIESTSNTTKEQVVHSRVSSKKIVDFKSTLPPASPEQLRVIEMLKKAGVQGQRAVAYALLPEGVAQTCIRDAQSAVDAGRVRLDKRVGYLIGALSNQLKAQTSRPTSPPDPLSMPPVRTSQGYGEGELFADVEPMRVMEVAAPEAVNEKLLVLVNGKMSAADVWSAAYHQLELQLDNHALDTWLRGAKLVDVVDGCLVVKVRSSYARNMCQHSRLVARVLKDVAGCDVPMRFEADEQSAVAASGGLGRFLAMKPKN